MGVLQVQKATFLVDAGLKSTCDFHEPWYDAAEWGMHLMSMQAVNKLDTHSGGLFPKVMQLAWPWIARDVDTAVRPLLYATTAAHVIGDHPLHAPCYLHVIAQEKVMPALLVTS